MRPILVSVLLVATAISAGGQQTDDGSVPVAPLFDGMGSHHHAITTSVPLAQKYFDQGLTLAWGFNHAESERSFREAARLDPECAMCWWGVALVQGPNINLPMQPEANPTAWEAIQKAQELKAGASKRERAYIEALATRYVADPPEDRGVLDQAYAAAMRRVADADLDDDDARVLFAEALMDTTPWDYWETDGRPNPAGAEILAALESVLARSPTHVGANHLYIHTVEKAHPTWGVAAATRLGDLVPAAGHLVHMPAHIWIRVGRFHDAIVANERAIQADNRYVSQCRMQGVYPLGYMPHNHHFLWEVALLVGNRGITLEQAEYLRENTDVELMRDKGLAWLQHFWVTPLFSQVAFGMWNDILEGEAPPEDLAYPAGVWSYARTMALIRTGRLDEARDELETLQRAADNTELEGIEIGTTHAAALVRIAAGVAAGELAAAEGDFESAVRSLRSTVAMEDALTYDEPPDWPLPVRHNLGAVLLEAGRPAEAERVFREDLARFPGNGRSLFGLAKSVAAQGRDDEAARVREELEAASADVDTPITAARL